MSEDLISSGRAWVKEVVDLYKEGYSDAEVASYLKITIKEYYKTMAENPAFGKVVELGRTHALAFWEGQGRKNIGNKSFNTPLWSFYMKNKHGWADKSETISQNENLNTDLDSLRQKIDKELEKVIKARSPELTDAQRVLTLKPENYNE